MTDNTGRTAQLTVEDYLGSPFYSGERVRCATQVCLRGSLTYDQVVKIAEEILANKLIETISISSPSTSILQKLVSNKNRNVSVAFSNEPEIIDLEEGSLEKISKQRGLALNLPEMQCILKYYQQDAICKSRERVGLSKHPTDVELEVLAQTWSEHCKHKIFNAKIFYTENEVTEVIDSLFKTYISQATKKVGEGIDWLVSVFSDNAGVFRLSEQLNVAVKVETHNSPSALDPYGGALTGILGVNRDILGVGIGARLVANTDVFCFGFPDFSGPVPQRLLHPKRIFDGVCRGVEHGGNKSGVPTVNGAIVFDNSFLGKPLVYCGSIGLMPREVSGRASHVKEINVGDLIVVVGGRTGRDGIHGATFSSEELHADSPSSAVQIGDPFTQKKLSDFLLVARDRSLYRCITDNGAGGLSSSVGELAELSGGCKLHLDQVPLKCDDLKPWEILLSESQERMTLAVDLETIDALMVLAQNYEIELGVIGTFTNSGYFHVLFHSQTVAMLDMDFLHHGLPQMELEALWHSAEEKTFSLPQAEDFGRILKDILSNYNVCSKESVIRRYDHEVQGGSAMKPLVGLDGPSDAAIIRPIECMEGGKEAIVISNGICPKFSAFDTYHMAASAVDEALRNYVSVGGDPARVAILDNFCWPDPIFDPKKTPDGKIKLAELVRANKALFDMATAFNVPIISGKDSMKNDYKIGEEKISILPTLLISAVGKINNVERAISMDVKNPVDVIYVIGMTKDEMAGSEFALRYQKCGGKVPKVDAISACKRFHAISQAIEKELLVSCHDCSDGGLAVALAEKSFAGGLGIEVDLAKVAAEEALCDLVILFSESNSRFVVTVSPDNLREFEEIVSSHCISKIGVVRGDDRFVIQGTRGIKVVEEDISSLKQYWQRPLGDRSHM